MIAYAMARKRGQAPASGRSVATPVWILFAAAALAVLVTYARLPPAELYNTSVDGLAGGLGRALVLLNFPTAIAALGVLAVCAPLLSRREAAAAWAAAALCAIVAVPGVVEQDDLDAKWVNVLPALGVAIAVVLSLRARPVAPRRLAGDPLRGVAAALLVVLAVPWLFAELGFYAPDPILADELAARPAPDEETLAAVHLGHHHGTDGVLLALAALLLSRARPLPAASSWLLAFMLAYGVGNAAQDGWLEQVVKRGWTEHGLPGLLRPSLDWLALAGGAVLVELLWFRRERRQPRERVSAWKSSSHSDMGT
jgi:hypothetical protein